MRISFVNSFPVQIVDGQPESGHWSMAGIPGTTQKVEDAKFRLALKRIKQWSSWNALHNPFLEPETFMEWFFDHTDASYMSTQTLLELRASRVDAMYERSFYDHYDDEPVHYETIGLSVVKAD